MEKKQEFRRGTSDEEKSEGIITYQVDKKTGKIIFYTDENMILKTEKSAEQTREYFKRLEGINYNAENFNEIQREYLGNFVFFVFEKLDYLVTVLGEADTVKFIYLGTFVKPNGYLANDLAKNKLTKKDISELIGINKNAFGKFYTKLLNLNLLIKDDLGIKIDENYFIKGKIKAKKEDKFTRLYVREFQELYKNTLQKGERSGKLIIIFKVLPKVHWRYNILCNKPSEEELDHIEAMTVNVLSNLSRFRQDLFGLQVDGKGIFKSHIIDKKEYISINPSIHYHGNRYQDIWSLIDLFGIEKIK